MSAAAVQAAVAVKPVGMTSTAYIMLVFVIISVPLLAAILRQLIKNQPEMRKIESEDDASLRTILLTRIESLESKVDKSEAECLQRIDAALASSDRRWDLKMAEMRRDYETRIESLTRQLVAFQISSGRPLGFTPEAVASAERTMAHIERKEAGA